MNLDETLQKCLSETIDSVDFPHLGKKISGKVRDSYVIGDKRILISSDRLSAFDVMLTTIPCKGKVLNDIAAYWFKKTKHIIPNHIISRPHPNVFVVKQVEIIPIEVVVRGYLAGGGWREYARDGKVSGVVLPTGLTKHCKLPEPLITPSTKEAQGGHDIPISEAEIIKQGICPQALWNEVRNAALALYNFAAEDVANRGLILVDTKYEFGVLTNKDGSRTLLLADEVHTPDSSRFWNAESYFERFSSGVDPEMLDKEFVRRWLMDRGYMGEGKPPSFPDAFRVDVAKKYIEAYEKITGERFVVETSSLAESVAKLVES